MSTQLAHKLEQGTVITFTMGGNYDDGDELCPHCYETWCDASCEDCEDCEEGLDHGN